MSNLPEFSNPPDLYYNDKESKSYHSNTRITKIQAEITYRAIELLEIEDDTPFVLDVGCGSGLSGDVLNHMQYPWVGLDLSPSMLAIANTHVPSYGYMCHDMGCKLPFAEESFDYAISISSLQWLFHSFKKEHVPLQRLRTFFHSLYRTIRKRAVLQFYCSKKEIEILKKEATNAGFFGGLVTDNENTKNSKQYLVLSKIKPKNKELADDFEKSRGQRPKSKLKKVAKFE